MPSGSEVVAMVSALFAAIVKLNVAEAVSFGEDESLTFTVTWLVPPALGVPVIAPVEELMLKPFGRPVADQVYGDVPPLTASVAL